MKIARLYCTNCGAEIRLNGETPLYGRRVHVLFVQLAAQVDTADVPEYCDCGARILDGRLGLELAEGDEESDF